MKAPASTTQLRLAALALLFVLYPAIRQFSDETSLQGAAAFSSQSRVVAHTLAMFAFVLVTRRLDDPGTENTSGSLSEDIEFDADGFVTLYRGFLERVS